MKARHLLAVAALTAALVGMTSTLSAFADGVNDLPAVTDADLLSSITDIELQVSDIDIVNSVRDLQQVKQQGSDTVVTLTSDILFAFSEAELSAAAKARISSLVAKVPQGGPLSVAGHTDNVGTPASNLALSQQRASAVAAVIAKARPDIELTVQGLGESQPVADNETGGKDNPDGRKLNRRVELRYQG